MYSFRMSRKPILTYLVVVSSIIFLKCVSMSPEPIPKLNYEESRNSTILVLNIKDPAISGGIPIRKDFDLADGEDLIGVVENAFNSSFGSVVKQYLTDFKVVFDTLGYCGGSSVKAFSFAVDSRPDSVRVTAPDSACWEKKGFNPRFILGITNVQFYSKFMKFDKYGGMSNCVQFNFEVFDLKSRKRLDSNAVLAWRSSMFSSKENWVGPIKDAAVLFIKMSPFMPPFKAPERTRR